MKIIYKNFEIETDRSSYILTEYGESGDKAKNQGEIVVKDQIYPSTLEKCFEKILYRIKKNNNSVIELSKYMTEIKEINKEFLGELKIISEKLLSNQKESE